MAILKKQLEEREKQLAAEQEDASAAKNRLRELTKVRHTNVSQVNKTADGARFLPQHIISSVVLLAALCDLILITSEHKIVGWMKIFAILRSFLLLRQKVQLGLKVAAEEKAMCYLNEKG